jgi:hypothetical protein
LCQAVSSATENQKAIDGKNTPSGSWYGPSVIRVAGHNALLPDSRSQRRSSVWRVGTKKPGPGSLGVAQMAALRSSTVSATACPRRPIPAAYPTILPVRSTRTAARCSIADRNSNSREKPCFCKQSLLHEGKSSSVARRTTSPTVCGAVDGAPCISTSGSRTAKPSFV